MKRVWLSRAKVNGLPCGMAMQNGQNEQNEQIGQNGHNEQNEQNEPNDKNEKNQQNKLNELREPTKQHVQIDDQNKINHEITPKVPELTKNIES